MKPPGKPPEKSPGTCLPASKQNHSKKHLKNHLRPVCRVQKNRRDRPRVFFCLFPAATSLIGFSAFPLPLCNIHKKIAATSWLCELHWFYIFFIIVLSVKSITKAKTGRGIRL